MSENFKSLHLILHISDFFNIKDEVIIKKYNTYYDFIKNSKKLNIKPIYFLEKTIYLVYLFYLISPIHLIILNLYHIYINKLNNKKVILNVNKALISRWKRFSNYKSVYTLVLDNFFVKIFFKRLPFKKMFYVINNYIKLLFTYLLNKKYRTNNFYDIELFQKFLNDYMIGSFLGGLNSQVSLDAGAYTLNFAKYIGIKEINKEIDVCALQVHAASREPMMVFFQADKIFSINERSSIFYPQIIGDREEKVVGSRLLENYIESASESLKFKPQGKSILVLFGNTHHPNGLYYGPNHNKTYKKFLEDLIKLSEDFNYCKCCYLHHKNFKSNFEVDFLANSSFIQLDPFLNVYLTSLKFDFVISFGSTVVTELYNYHPNIYIYSPSTSSPYRVQDENFRYINSYNNLKELISSYLNNKNNNTNVNNAFINKNFNNLIDFDQRLYKSCIKK